MYRMQTVERSERAWQAATIVAVVVAIAALGVAIVALSRPRSTTAQRSNAAEFATLSGEIRSLKAELATVRSEGESSSAGLSKAQGAITKITTCLPELSGEINGLTAEVSGGSVFLSQHNQVSSYCSSTLEKH
jgi:hypothetical protein